MKKNISINISGIIFHIEEDGYETLKKYLDSINKYFSTFEDSSEILADIESRIAEIFLSKLNEEKQVITSDDVNALVATMGSVSDFRAAEDQEETNTETQTENTAGPENAGTSSQPKYKYSAPNRLMRDQKRKILGGVCAGLANYFNIDALWIRLLFALLLLAYGLPLFVYLVMWVVVPGSYDLDEPIVGKKMYRDPERRVLGGVSGGVAAYLNIDIIAVRILFIIFTVFGGLGLFVYILLWIILPEARSLTDKMQMQGEPVTLSNIESTIKKSQSEPVAEEESTLTKILLFPFRLIGMILRGIGVVLVPIVEVIRVGIGVFIVLIGLGLLFSLVVSAGILFGIFSAAAFSPWMSEMNESTVPVDAFLRAFPSWTAVAAFVGTVVPTVFLILLGVSVIAKRIVFNATAGWTLFVMFFISVALLAVGVPKIIFSFKEEAEYRVENSYKLNGKTAVLKINETGMDDYDGVTFHLKGHTESDFRLVQSFEAQGSSRAKAIENAKMVEYNVGVRDSVFHFDSNLRFKPDAIFRAQRLKMTLFIPYNFPFTMDEGVSRLISQYVDYEYLDGYTWKMTNDGLECITCPKSERQAENDEDCNGACLTNETCVNGVCVKNEASSTLRDFDEIEINGKFDVRITHGNEYSVEVTGAERKRGKYDIHRRGETLIIDYNDGRDFNERLKNLKIDGIKINITMPSLEKIEATGVGNIRFDDFTSDDVEIELRGPVKLKGDIKTNRLTLNLTGGSEADLSGDANSMEARVEMASKLRAYNLQVRDAFVEASGASSAKVNVTERLEIEETMASKIDYRGNPTLIKRD